MKIAIISTYDTRGGAARAAFRLHKGLLQKGHDSVMVVKKKFSENPNVEPVSDRAGAHAEDEWMFRVIQRRAVDLNRSDFSDTWFSIPYPGYDITGLQAVQEADVLNLHWVAGFQSVESISLLLALGKPVVWTVHDQNPLTGGCHYTGGCLQYQDTCGNCPQLKRNSHRTPYLILQNKRRLFTRALTLVAPSRWMGACAAKSAVFAGNRIEVIPNSLEIDVFKPNGKREAKERFGLPEDAVVILFGADHHKETRKGFGELVKALAYCRRNHKFSQMLGSGAIRLVTFGNPIEKSNCREPGIQHMGFIGNDRTLSDLYSAADLYVLPSLEDNLPNNLLESMSCGTPVVGFDVGGIADVIVQDQNGYVASPHHPEQLGQFILDMTFDAEKRARLGLAARRLMTERFTLSLQAETYLQLFDELLNEHRRGMGKGQEMGGAAAGATPVQWSRLGHSRIDGELASSFHDILRKREIARELYCKVKILLKRWFTKIKKFGN